VPEIEDFSLQPGFGKVSVQAGRSFIIRKSGICEIGFGFLNARHMRYPAPAVLQTGKPLDMATKSIYQLA